MNNDVYGLFLQKAVTMDTDFEPYGKRERNAPDCSCGCIFFVPLEGHLGSDWGVCANPASPRAALLTFEHFGCPQYKGFSPRR